MREKLNSDFMSTRGHRHVVVNNAKVEPADELLGDSI